MPGRRTETPTLAVDDGTVTLTDDGMPIPTVVDGVACLSVVADGEEAAISGERWEVTKVSNGGREYFSAPTVVPTPWVVGSVTTWTSSGSSRLIGATTAIGT